MKNEETAPPLVFVYLGNPPPTYARDSMIFASKGRDGRIILLTDVDHSIPADRRYEVQKIDEWYDPSEFGKFAERSVMDGLALGGFWLRALERFFVLYQFMERNNISRLFHAELDVLVFSLQGVAAECERKRGIFAVRDSPERALASIFYVNSLEFFRHFIDFLSTQVDVRNEMVMLGNYFNQFPEKGHSLPSSSSLNPSPPADNWGYDPRRMGLFDAAAFGQWLFGVDPRHVKSRVRNHFRNETVNFPIELLRFSLFGRGRRLRVSQPTGTSFELRNLHIHSKILRRLRVPGVLRFYLGINGWRRPLTITHRKGWFAYEVLSSLLGARWSLTRRLHRFAGPMVSRVLVFLSSRSTRALSQRQSQRLGSIT